MQLPALAHHGWSSYQQEQLLTFTGVVKKGGYEHPHGFIWIETEGRTLHVILAPPFRMETRGLAREAIAAGKEVTVEGYARRDNVNEIRAERIRAAGTTVELR